jgi:hypothetical protein
MEKIKTQGLFLNCKYHKNNNMVRSLLLFKMTQKYPILIQLSLPNQKFEGSKDDNVDPIYDN